MVQYITQLDIKDQSWRLKEKKRNLKNLQNNNSARKRKTFIVNLMGWVVMY